ncbi:MAG: hypothetical protein AAF800_11805 [Planctomycetota bacterium]
MIRLPRPRPRPRTRLAAGIAAVAFALPLLLAAPSAAADHHHHHHRSVCVSSHGKSYGHRHHSSYYRTHDDRQTYDRRYYRVSRGDYGYRQVRHSGYHRRVWVPPVYRTRYDSCGKPLRVCVRRGYYRTVFVAGHRGGGRY